MSDLTLAQMVAMVQDLESRVGALEAQPLPDAIAVPNEYFIAPDGKTEREKTSGGLKIGEWTTLKIIGEDIAPAVNDREISVAVSFRGGESGHNIEGFVVLFIEEGSGGKSVELAEWAANDVLGGSLPGLVWSYSFILPQGWKARFHNKLSSPTELRVEASELALD